MADVVMPRLSDSMEEGTILQWLKQVGDEVAVGDELVEIETDKANMAYESDVAGTLTEILAEEGETLPIGSTIARVGDGRGTMGSAAGPVTGEGPAGGAAAPFSAPPPRHPQESRTTAGGTDGAAADVRATPVARRVAAATGVDLGAVSGSGPGAKVTKEDVLAANGGAPTAAAGAGEAKAL